MTIAHQYNDTVEERRITTYTQLNQLEHNNDNDNDNKLCACRHDMPPPLSSPWAPQRLARRLADATFPTPNTFSRSPLHLPHALRPRWVKRPTRPWPPLTLKVVSESRVTWAISMPILVFLGLSVLDLGPMYATDRRQVDKRQTSDIA